MSLTFIVTLFFIHVHYFYNYCIMKYFKSYQVYILYKIYSKIINNNLEQLNIFL